MAELHDVKDANLDAAAGDGASDASSPQEPTEAPPSLRLDDALKFFGIASTGGQAKFLIQQGEGRVNGQVETRRKHRLVAGDKVTVLGEGFVMEFERNPEP